MSKRLFEAAVASSVLGLAALLLGASGLVPVKASSGHWAITEWLLQFGKRRSVATHTLNQDLPPLDDPALVLKGAGHYENGCRPCHGSPEFERPRIAAAMTPPPPYLVPVVAEYDPEELFYIVKHGIKFTGMPAWPAQQRDDEVRAVVAFLVHELPKLDAASYRRLIDGDGHPSTPGDGPELAFDVRTIVGSCARCHGPDGNGRGLGAFPKLAGQRRDYLSLALEAYANEQRQSGIMGPIAAALQPKERSALADYYSKLPLDSMRDTSGGQAPDSTDSPLLRGERIANQGIPDQGVPSCVDCHGPGSHERGTAYPSLAGQYASYLRLQLELLARSDRGGSPYVGIMRHVATRLNTAQMRDVATYYESLSAGASRTAP